MISDLLKAERPMLAEFAVAERLRRFPGVELHPTLYHTPLIYGRSQEKTAMRSVYAEYIQTAASGDVPLLLTAPTWRLDGERVRAAGVPETINRDAVAFLDALRCEVGREEDAVTILGALLGPQRDCYRPELAPGVEAARAFHAQQVGELAETPIEFLLAQTLPNVDEALGMSMVMAEAELPYIIGFCVSPTGLVLDGHTIQDAMRRIDDECSRPPLGYFASCTYPGFISSNVEAGTLDRLIGIQANGSSKDVTQLDGASETMADPVDVWADAMVRLQREQDLNILGGCCGTSREHMQAILDRWRAASS